VPDRSALFRDEGYEFKMKSFRWKSQNNPLGKYHDFLKAVGYDERPSQGSKHSRLKDWPTATASLVI
jgi:hypothetical protein